MDSDSRTGRTNETDIYLKIDTNIMKFLLRPGGDTDLFQIFRTINAKFNILRQQDIIKVTLNPRHIQRLMTDVYKLVDGLDIIVVLFNGNNYDGDTFDSTSDMIDNRSGGGGGGSKGNSLKNLEMNFQKKNDVCFGISSERGDDNKNNTVGVLVGFKKGVEKSLVEICKHNSYIGYLKRDKSLSTGDRGNSSSNSNEFIKLLSFVNREDDRDNNTSNYNPQSRPLSSSYATKNNLVDNYNLNYVNVMTDDYQNVKKSVKHDEMPASSLNVKQQQQQQQRKHQYNEANLPSSYSINPVVSETEKKNNNNNNNDDAMVNECVLYTKDKRKMYAFQGDLLHLPVEVLVCGISTDFHLDGSNKNTCLVWQLIEKLPSLKRKIFIGSSSAGGGGGCTRLANSYKKLAVGDIITEYINAIDFPEYEELEEDNDVQLRKIIFVVLPVLGSRVSGEDEVEFNMCLEALFTSKAFRSSRCIGMPVLASGNFGFGYKISLRLILHNYMKYLWKQHECMELCLVDINPDFIKEFLHMHRTVFNKSTMFIKTINIPKKYRLANTKGKEIVENTSMKINTDKNDESFYQVYYNNCKYRLVNVTELGMNSSSSSSNNNKNNNNKLSGIRNQGINSKTISNIDVILFPYNETHLLPNPFVKFVKQLERNYGVSEVKIKDVFNLPHKPSVMKALKLNAAANNKFKCKLIIYLPTYDNLTDEKQLYNLNLAANYALNLCKFQTILCPVIITEEFTVSGLMSCCGGGGGGGVTNVYVVYEMEETFDNLKSAFGYLNFPNKGDIEVPK